MEVPSIVLVLVVITATWYGYKRRVVVDKDMQSLMLDYLKNNESFTVSQFIKVHNLKNNFFVKSKVRMAASELTVNKVINHEIPSSSSFFNRDETIKFLRK